LQHLHYRQLVAANRDTWPIGNASGDPSSIGGCYNYMLVQQTNEIVGDKKGKLGTNVNEKNSTVPTTR